MARTARSRKPPKTAKPTWGERLVVTPAFDEPRPPMSRVDWLVLLAAMLVAASLLFIRLGEHPFWDDEAITAYFGRAIAEKGHPTAIYHENLNAVRNGLELFPNLDDRAFPQVNFYVTALSFWLFKADTFYGRLPHALLGLATIPALFWASERWLRDRRIALAAAGVLAVWVPFLLYARQCRYYAMSMLLGTILFGLYPDLSIRKWKRLIVFSLLMLLSFHNHYYMTVALAGALGVLALITWNRRALLALGVTAAFMALTLLPWYFVIRANQSADVSDYALPNAHVENIKALIKLFFYGMNRFDFFQLGFLAILIPVCWFWWKQDRARCARFLQWVPFVVAFVVLTAVLFPIPKRHHLPGRSFLDVRYLLMVLPMLALAMTVIAVQVFRLNRPAGSVLFLLFIGTDLLCGYDFNAENRMKDYAYNLASSPVCAKYEIPFRSFLADYLVEVMSPHNSVYAELLAFLEANTAPGDTILTDPRFHSQVFLFYFGDRLRICGLLEADNEHILKGNRDKISPHVYSTDFVPKWIVQFRDELYHTGFRRAIRWSRARFEEHRLSLDRRNQVRPEVRWRTFRPFRAVEPDERVLILECIDPGRGTLEPPPK